LSAKYHPPEEVTVVLIMSIAIQIRLKKLLQPKRQPMTSEASFPGVAMKQKYVSSGLLLGTILIAYEGKS